MPQTVSIFAQFLLVQTELRLGLNNFTVWCKTVYWHFLVRFLTFKVKFLHFRVSTRI